MLPPIAEYDSLCVKIIVANIFPGLLTSWKQKPENKRHVKFVLRQYFPASNLDADQQPWRCKRKITKHYY